MPWCLPAWGICTEIVLRLRVRLNILNKCVRPIPLPIYLLIHAFHLVLWAVHCNMLLVTLCGRTVLPSYAALMFFFLLPFCCSVNVVLCPFVSAASLASTSPSCLVYTNPCFLLYWSGGKNLSIAGQHGALFTGSLELTYKAFKPHAPDQHPQQPGQRA